ncbi:MAG: amidohydrolase family protein [Chloroflexota bacterium]
MSTSSLDFSHIDIVDNHAHALTKSQPRDPVEFRQNFTEAHSPVLARRHVPFAVQYRWALRQLAALLETEATEEAILQRRREMGFDRYARHLADDANLAWLLLDLGYPPPAEACSPEEMEQLLGVRVGKILRIETLLQELIPENKQMAGLLEIFDKALATARADGYVALKSIAAYRTGLAIEQASDDDAEQALSAIVETLTIEPFRLTSKPLIDYFVLRALRFAARHALPIQFHTGYGDPDLDLRLSNPLHLRDVFEDASLSSAPIVLLHESFPFTAEAAYLAAVYPNAYLDVAFSLPPLDRGELLRVLRMALGAAPASKIMVSSDGTRIPEHYWLGATRARHCLSQVMEALVTDSVLGEADAGELGAMVLRDNAVRLYGLGESPAAASA